MKRILSIIFATCLFIGLFACVKAVIDKPEDDVTIEDSSSGGNAEDSSGGTDECEHEWVTDAAVAATCTEAGLTEGEHCSKCGEVLTAQEEIPAHGHMEHRLDKVEATCTEDGLTEGKKCSRCDVILVEQQVIPAFGHVEIIEISAVAATCTEAGHTESRKCARCNAVISTSQSIPALGHEEVVDPAVAATCTTAGKTEGKHCSRCSTVLTAQTTIAALGHAEVVDAAVAATRTTEGKTEGKHCSRCNTILTAQTTILKLEVLSGKWELKTLDVEFGNVLSFSATLSFSCNNTTYTDKQLRLWHLDDGSSYVQIGLSTSFAVGDVFDFGSTEQEVSGEFYAMFDKFFDPVVEYKLSGVWKFKDDFKSADLAVNTGVETDSYVEVNFMSNGTSYVKFKFTDEISYYKADGTCDSVFFRAWDNSAYATVDFGSTEQTVTERFYNWFTSNASQYYTLSGVWKFNSGAYKAVCAEGTPDEDVNFYYAGLSFVKLIRAGSYIQFVESGGTALDYGWSPGISTFDELISFGTTEQEVTADFYNWFTSNATQQTFEACYVTLHVESGQAGASLEFYVNDKKAYYFRDIDSGSSPFSDDGNFTFTLVVPKDSVLKFHSDWGYCGNISTSTVSGNVTLVSASGNDLIVKVTGDGTVSMPGVSD